MKRGHGYSLIEVVMVITIAGILAAVVIPRFTQPEVNASWFFEQVKAGVRYAQRQAVDQRRTVYVMVSANSVQLCYAAPPPPCASPVADFGTGNAYLLNAPTGVALDPVNFSFNAFGQPSAATVFNVGGLPITVLAETGYVP